MTPMPPSSASTIAIAARVIVSMLADTIGRLSVRCSENARAEIDRGRIAARHHAELRRQQKVVEGATADEVEQIHGNLRFQTADFRLADFPVESAKICDPEICDQKSP